jgi:CubicO group peptidase (beta-lactamase class C family)
MKILIRLVASVLLAATFVGAQGKANPKLTNDLTKELEEIRKTSLLPGFAASIVNEKGVVYAKGFGMADVKQNAAFTPLTINWVASVSKTFIALSIMKLVEQGRLDLDDQINSILPYKIINPHFPDTPITVRHLVTHTSSINDSFEPYKVGEADVVLENENDTSRVPAYMQPNVDWHRMSKKISLDENIRKFMQPNAKWYSADSFSKKEPGTHFEYSNLASSIAARIVEAKSGMSFVEFTKRFIFEPLRMKNTAWEFSGLNPKLVSKIYIPNEEKNPTGVAEYPQYYMTNYPVSGLKTNINDLGLYLIEMIKGSSGNGKLLNRETYKLLFEPQLNKTRFPKLDTGSVRNNEGMSVFWSINKDGECYHLGGSIGVYSFVKFNPKTKTGSLAFSNMRDDDFGRVQSVVYKYEKAFSGR